MKANYVDDLYEENDNFFPKEFEKYYKSRKKSKFHYSKLLEYRLYQVRKHNVLYEGLITSYSVKDTIRYFTENIKKKGLKNIRYSYSYNNLALPYIIILFNYNSYSTIIGEWIISLFKVCGWEIADISDINGIKLRDKNNSFDEMINSNVGRFVFRAKFDVEIEKKNWPKYLYHMSPSIKKDKILKKGLIPKTENKLIKHEDAVYMLDMNDKIDIEILAQDLNDRSIKKHNSYSLFEINTTLFPEFFKLYMDPDLEYSYFTKDNISPYCLKFLKDIKV